MGTGAHGVGIDGAFYWGPGSRYLLVIVVLEVTPEAHLRVQVVAYILGEDLVSEKLSLLFTNCVCAGMLDVNGLFSAVSEEEFLEWHSDILEFRSMLLDV